MVRVKCIAEDPKVKEWKQLTGVVGDHWLMSRAL
jgi:hypothetical protein